ncbi:hypothetical protein M440DRAFT_350283 [Trichoderma longibrachiatum ATCC 18648]|uniref:Uncharacterized protein n=1 Tax=Trichoderma longibrachiatum ATCC 18648 TaxID=983965 RepID=A0A2T4BR22_TRILO|nr:hypothetical protein M440DRAFT_350283 [Trichoderma longibrachiatum ATCC 18648]
MQPSRSSRSYHWLESKAKDCGRGSKKSRETREDGGRVRASSLSMYCLYVPLHHIATCIGFDGKRQQMDLGIRITEEGNNKLSASAHEAANSVAAHPSSASAMLSFWHIMRRRIPSFQLLARAARQPGKLDVVAIAISCTRGGDAVPLRRRVTDDRRRGWKLKETSFQWGLRNLELETNRRQWRSILQWTCRGSTPRLRLGDALALVDSGSLGAGDALQADLVRA